MCRQVNDHTGKGNTRAALSISPVARVRPGKDLLPGPFSLSLGSSASGVYSSNLLSARATVVQQPGEHRLGCTDQKLNLSGQKLSFFSGWHTDLWQSDCSFPNGFTFKKTIKICNLPFSPYFARQYRYFSFYADLWFHATDLFRCPQLP